MISGENTMQQYRNLVLNRSAVIDGVGPWNWVAGDSGAWDGPTDDWETSHKQKYFANLKNNQVAIQAGGNCGLYPRLLAQRFNWVYTFEPDPLNFHVLVNNCQMDNITKIQGALGETHDMIQVHRFDISNVGMHRVVEAPGSKIPQFLIDDLGLEHCDFIQLDIEGYEIHALRGAVKTIDKFRPVIVVENCNQAILDLLSKYNYSVDSVSKMDTVLSSK